MPVDADNAHRWGHRSGGAPFTQITDDLADAIALAGLSRYAGFVLRQVIRQSWEPGRYCKRGDPLPDPLPVRLRPRELERQTGLHNTHICRAINRLVEQRILLRTDAGLLFNKRADQWEESPGKPLLTPEMLRFCMASGHPKRATSRGTNPLPPQVANATSSGSSVLHPLPPEAAAATSRGCIQLPLEAPPTVHPPAPPLCKTARASELDLIRDPEDKIPPSAPPWNGGGGASGDLASPRPGSDRPGRGRRGQTRESKEEARRKRDREISEGLRKLFDHYEPPEWLRKIEAENERKEQERKDREREDQKRKEAACPPTNGFYPGPTAT